MAHDGLTLEQQAVVDCKRTAFVAACPGAGKTRVIVDAFMREAKRLPPAHGVLVLSFSRCAADEIRKRCARERRLSAPDFPHFLDTFDAFVGRFLVAPFKNRWCPDRPVTYLDSWERLGAKVLLRGRSPLPPFPLSAFEVVDVDTVKLQLRNIDYGLRREAAKNETALNVEANAERLRLLKAGYMTCADGRALALTRVREERGRSVLRALAARFPVAFIDEAQDCNIADLEILKRLMGAGVRMLAVGDPQQDIYRFRGANAQRVVTAFARAEQLRITGNHRSTENICRFASSLKVAAHSDRAVGRYGAEDTPVVVLSYGRSPVAAVGDAFMSRLGALGIDDRDAAVLAHREADALSAVGRVPHDGGLSRLAKLAAAAEVFRAAKTRPADVLAATEHVEMLLLAMYGVKCVSALPEEVAKRNDIDPVALRTEALRALCALATAPVGDDPETRWLSRARGVLDSADVLLATGRTCTSGTVLPKPTKNWHVPATPCAFRGPAMTVHAAKGRECGGVLVVLPRGKRTTQLLDEWEARRDSESRAVLYVAATRAQRLLVLAVAAEHAARVHSLAARDGAACVLDVLPA